MQAIEFLRQQMARCTALALLAAFATGCAPLNQLPSPPVGPAAPLPGAQALPDVGGFEPEAPRQEQRVLDEPAPEPTAEPTLEPSAEPTAAPTQAPVIESTPKPSKPSKRKRKPAENNDDFDGAYGDFFGGEDD